MKRNVGWTSAALLSSVFAIASGTAAAMNTPTATNTPSSMSTSSNKPVSDRSITSHVRHALAKDKDTKARNIKVSTMHGVVSLSGTARSDAEKQKAEQDARNVKGVTDVRNDLTVRQPS